MMSMSLALAAMITTGWRRQAARSLAPPLARDRRPGTTNLIAQCNHTFSALALPLHWLSRAMPRWPGSDNLKHSRARAHVPSLALPLDAQARQHEVALQPLHDFVFNRPQGRARARHLQHNHRLHASDATEVEEIDSTTGYLEEGPDRVQDSLHSLRRELRPALPKILNDVDNLGDFLAQTAFQPHLHRHGGARASTACSFKLQPYHPAVYFNQPHISAIANQVRPHFIQHALHVILCQ
mmetsp:Transcript_63034/g.131017  ORF Transcript_63034/g.131017 Transcript_63034/m.131017 type:complete len:239 (-) Transcript_63034:327-1043(-)